MAKRGMKRGSICLSPADQRVLKKFDDAIAKLRSEKSGGRSTRTIKVPRAEMKQAAKRGRPPGSKNKEVETERKPRKAKTETIQQLARRINKETEGLIGESMFPTTKAGINALGKVNFFRQPKVVAAVEKAVEKVIEKKVEEIRHTPGTGPYGTHTSD